MKKLLTTSLLALMISGCGGGGGDSDFIGAALVSLNASPTKTDPGDRTEIMLHLAEVNDNGIALKVRFPTSLAYVPASSTLEVSGEDTPIDVTPAVTVRVNALRYVVYFFKRSLFGDNNQGTLKLQLAALSDDSGAKIEVDADVDDPRISNLREFDVNNPEFEAEDSETIEIVN